ncbi:hypothetical protein [Sinobaca sp. H24]|uniref:hypothetical protein n=1 Tax=Sinobaca sp. H24 TaxID=2923376 RepID=UPI002079C8B8|nr:hypothetical protein [Sinobaca sp. H24]
MPDSNIDSAVTLSRSVKEELSFIVCGFDVFRYELHYVYDSRAGYCRRFFPVSFRGKLGSDGYIIIYAVGALVYGKLADLYPFKRLLTVGLILFAVGSIIAFSLLIYYGRKRQEWFRPPELQRCRLLYLLLLPGF